MESLRDSRRYHPGSGGEVRASTACRPYLYQFWEGVDRAGLVRRRVSSFRLRIHCYGATRCRDRAGGLRRARSRKAMGQGDGGPFRLSGSGGEVRASTACRPYLYQFWKGVDRAGLVRRRVSSFRLRIHCYRATRCRDKAGGLRRARSRKAMGQGDGGPFRLSGSWGEVRASTACRPYLYEFWKLG